MTDLAKLSGLRWTPILYDVAQTLESVQDPETRIDRALALLRTCVPYDRCALLEVAPILARRITILPAPCAQDEAELLTRRLGELLCLLVEHPLDDDLRSGTLLTGAERAHLAVPIFSLGEVIGLCLVERSAPSYDEGHLAFLSVVAAQIGAYLTALRADRDLRHSEARFRGLYQSGMIGIAFLGLNGASRAGGWVSDANDAFLQLLGRTRHELRAGALVWREMTPQEYAALDQRAFQEALERGACAPYEKEFVKEDGRRVAALVGAARLDASDTLVAFVLDVTARKRVEAERSSLLEQRERDVEFLQMFVAMLGHDLRNPLNAVRISADHLRRTEGERLARPVGRILSSSDRMERMVEQLLDLTRIRLAGGVPIEGAHVDLADLCRRAIDEIKVAEPDASIHSHIEGDTVGHWDGDRLLQVVSNLVSNAVQHAEGEPQVLMRIVGKIDTVELYVHNMGVIAPELLPTLFDPFRGNQLRARLKGLGLGLFITRHIVEAHGGSIAVDSSELEGTTFTVRLPRVTEYGDAGSQ